jgi:alpha-tubulin suppressor-like RCC1 family protein
MPRAPRLSAFVRVAAVLAITACKDQSPAAYDPLDAPLVSVTAGVLHTCGVTTTGRLYCWGWNRDGQLGDGSRSDRVAPVPVGDTTSFVAVSAGGAHTCAVTGGSAVRCWGFNLSGQLGDGTTATRLTPVAVGTGLDLTLVESGGAYTCAVASSDSTAYCWGLGGGGQLGRVAPEVCASRTGSDPCARSPAAVTGGLKLTRISAGVYHTCAITADSSAYCWGANARGQLGNGTTADSATTVPVAVTGGLKFVAVSVGLDHSCALTVVGDAYCWGDNALGQLGDTAVTGSSAPHAVESAETFSSLTTGANFTCGVTSTAAAYCWGANDGGQTGAGAGDTCASGAGTFPCSRLPAPVAGGLSFVTLGAGTRHTCGITTDQVAYCWGMNDQGQLGDGTRRASTVPVRVANQEGVP